MFSLICTNDSPSGNDLHGGVTQWSPDEPADFLGQGSIGIAGKHPEICFTHWRTVNIGIYRPDRKPKIDRVSSNP